MTRIRIRAIFVPIILALAVAPVQSIGATGLTLQQVQKIVQETEEIYQNACGHYGTCLWAAIRNLGKIQAAGGSGAIEIFSSAHGRMGHAWTTTTLCDGTAVAVEQGRIGKAVSLEEGNKGLEGVGTVERKTLEDGMKIIEADRYHYEGLLPPEINPRIVAEPTAASGEGATGLAPLSTAGRTVQEGTAAMETGERVLQIAGKVAKVTGEVAAVAGVAMVVADIPRKVEEYKVAYKDDPNNPPCGVAAVNTISEVALLGADLIPSKMGAQPDGKWGYATPEGNYAVKNMKKAYGMRPWMGADLYIGDDGNYYNEYAGWDPQSWTNPAPQPPAPPPAPVLNGLGNFTPGALGGWASGSTDPANGLTISNDTACLPYDSKISAPDGYLPVQNLKAGTKVYSLDEKGNRVVVLVSKVGSRKVSKTHHLVQVTLADGRTVRASKRHPLSDYRDIASLKIGDAYDHSIVTKTKEVPYTYGRTFDLLPASATGVYWVDGVPLGSTLRK